MPVLLGDELQYPLGRRDDLRADAISREQRD
jgi:hypothetical protein